MIIKYESPSESVDEIIAESSPVITENCSIITQHTQSDLNESVDDETSSIDQRCEVVAVGDIIPEDNHQSRETPESSYESVGIAKRSGKETEHLIVNKSTQSGARKFCGLAGEESPIKLDREIQTEIARSSEYIQVQRSIKEADFGGGGIEGIREPVDELV